MTSRPRPPKTPKPPQPAKDRRDFTLRPDDRTWKRLVKFCRAEEDATGKIPSKNGIILEALNQWLDRMTGKK